jgi:hypothetical protein
MWYDSEVNHHHCYDVTPLTGKELLAKVKELGDAAPKDQVARETGYAVTKKDGTERIQYTAFYEALMGAKGIAFAPAVTARAGRQLSYVATVQANGNLILGKGYTALQGAETGFEFKIELLENGGFSLSPIYYEDQANGTVAAEATTDPVPA